MSSSPLFLVDVDNTLLDNDAVVAALKRLLIDVVGNERAARYWVIFQELWAELGYADYLGALQRLRNEDPRDQEVAAVSRFLLEYPFGDRLYPGALASIARLRQSATVVVLSDGDVVYQRNKIRRSGLDLAVEGAVLVYIHKEEMLEDVLRRYPAERYVVVEDKLRILAAVKTAWKDRVTTVFVRQGSYALDAATVAAYPPADVTLERIGDLGSARL